MEPKRTPRRLLVVLGVLGAIISWGRGQSSNSAAASSHPQITAQQIVSEPAGASRCQFCHPSQVEGYERSAMAHPLRSAGQEPDGAVNTPDAKITMISSPCAFWQRHQAGER